ncbi:MAG: cas6 [Planctomycetaceae bacterium]|nr:cas6 [Planctomycetaceae bacterium]
MSKIDLSFPLISQASLPADHGYLLYVGLCRLMPQLHGSDGYAVHPVRGQQTGNRQLQLCPWSRLTFRAEAEKIPELIALAGKQLLVADRVLRVGIPEVHALTSEPAVRSRLVTTKNGQDAERFVKEIRRQLEAMQVSSEAILTLGKRRTIHIRDKEVVGHEVIIEGLSAEESLTIQEQGLGGRRHMGCGVFVPVRK